MILVPLLIQSLVNIARLTGNPGSNSLQARSSQSGNATLFPISSLLPRTLISRHVAGGRRTERNGLDDPAKSGSNGDGNVGVAQNVVWGGLRAPGAAVLDDGFCSTTVIRLGLNEIKISAKPTGQCSVCCPLRIDRDIRFLFYSRRRNRTATSSGTPMKYDAAVLVPRHIEPYADLRPLGVDPSLPSVFYIHGFLETCPGKSSNTILEGYEARPESYNIFVIDWSVLTAAPWYAQSVANVRVLGKVLAQFLYHHHKTGELPVQTVHIIGFSLGAHVAGITGKYLSAKGLVMQRITGLDPAFPGYHINDRRNRLTSQDAAYVDVMHTDARIFGYPVSIGHADFYPNAYRDLQPGCDYQRLLRTNSIDDIVSCSHQRAWYYYSESTKNPIAFPATNCKNWFLGSCNFNVAAYMGFGSNKNNTSKGEYFLVTRGRPPYGLSEKEQRLFKL